jgi:hypothetical protein
MKIQRLRRRFTVLKVFKTLAVVALCIQGTGCSKHEFKPRARKLASSDNGISTDQPPLELGEQWSSDNEDQTDQIISLLEQGLLKRAASDDFVRRDAHPKHHGCVKAYFKMDSSGLPQDLRVGIFAPGSEPVHAAWIRFSNGNPTGANTPDIKKDVRGMAIKLMNVPGAQSGSQDFVMMTSKEFFSKNGSDYLDLTESLSGSTVSLLWYLATHATPRKIILNAQIQAANPLQVDYFSAVPYKLGSRSMKFKVLPCASNTFFDTVPDKNASPVYLRERLVSTLEETGACFNFFVEPNMNPAGQPVEDPTLPWDESVSPYIKVATIEIPLQTGIDSAERMNFCENASFDPWHTLPETRPLGEINRMRLEIYSAISQFRHKYNNVPVIEPTSYDICSGASAPLCQTPKH